MVITDEDRLEYSIFQGEEGDVRLHTKKMRTSAKAPVKTKQRADIALAHQ